MRIALYAGAFKENQDGATRSLYQLVHSLQEDGITVAVWSYDPPEKAGGGWVERYTVQSLPLPFYPAYRISLPGPRTRRQLENIQPDLIFVAVADLAGRAFLHYARKKGLPVIASYHTDFASYLRYFRLGFLTSWAQRSLAGFFNRCHWVYAPTPTATRDLERWGVLRVRLWSRGIDHTQFHPAQRSSLLRRLWGPHGRKVILFAGRFVAYKNLEAVEEVYRRFTERQPERARFVMLGDGPWRRRLERTMPEAIFTGYRHGEELGQAFASADIFLFPSATETFGNVVLEALASGTPAVVADRGGCADIVRQSGAGIICPFEDHEAFFQACLLLCERPELLARMRAVGLDYTEGHSWANINTRVIEDLRAMQAFDPQPPGNWEPASIATPIISRQDAL